MRTRPRRGSGCWSSRCVSRRRTVRCRSPGPRKAARGLAGSACRFSPRDGGAAKTVIRTEEGIAAKDGVLARHAWAEIAGTFRGKLAGARVEDDDANPGYPHNGWLLRHGFGFLNVSYPGRKPLTIEPGKPLVLKYRVVLFSGESPAPAAGQTGRPAPRGRGADDAEAGVPRAAWRATHRRTVTRPRPRPQALPAHCPFGPNDACRDRGPPPNR